MSIRIGILGYGNLGRGVECAIKHNPDTELVAVFTRRDPETVKILTETAKVYSVKDAEKLKDEIDVLIICGGSATDLPVQTPEYVKYFNVVDSFDTHKKIPEHFANVDKAATESGHVGIISVGWDPGMFSLNRMYANAILTNGNDYTFWGKGVSQGHSDAIRRIPGVKDAKQYTIPVEAALIARNIAPGVFRKEFAFEKWVDFDQDMFDNLYNDDSQEREFTHKIYGYDNNPKANEIATHNVKAAGVSKDIILKLQPFQQFEQPAEKSIIITNPPYGERISTNDLLGLYSMIGERLKHAFVGNDAWVLSYREECFDQIGLKPSQKTPLFNGALECEFRKYQIFDGKYKEFKGQEGEEENKEGAPKEKREFKPRREEGGRSFSSDRDRKPRERRSFNGDRKPREFKKNWEPRGDKKE